MLDTPDSLQGHILDPSSPLTGMLGDQMMSLLKARTNIAESALPGLNESMLSMISSAINASMPDGRADSLQQAQHLSSALNVKNCIEKHLGNADLSVESLGSMTGVSRSQLYRMFKAYGGVYE